MEVSKWLRTFIPSGLFLGWAAKTSLLNRWGSIMRHLVRHWAHFLILLGILSRVIFLSTVLYITSWQNIEAVMLTEKDCCDPARQPAIHIHLHSTQFDLPNSLNTFETSLKTDMSYLWVPLSHSLINEFKKFPAGSNRRKCSLIAV
jgi:hypothetical protein